MMSILGKLFKKKEDDFSFDSSSSFSDTSNPFGDSTNTSDPFATNNSFGNSGTDPFSSTSSSPFGDAASNSDPFATPNTTGMPQRASSPPMPPMDDAHDIAPTRGSQIARDYITRQQQGMQPSSQTTSSSGNEHTLEIINLKLDAIKSQLEMLNQRLSKVEDKPKKLW